MIEIIKNLTFQFLYKNLLTLNIFLAKPIPTIEVIKRNENSISTFDQFNVRNQLTTNIVFSDFYFKGKALLCLRVLTCSECTKMSRNACSFYTKINSLMNDFKHFYV